MAVFLELIMFQSLLCWKLLYKYRIARRLYAADKVSILVMLEVTL